MTTVALSARIPLAMVTEIVSHANLVIMPAWSCVVVDRLSMRLVPDEPWTLVEPLEPEFRTRPQGGGTARLPDRAVFTAIVYML